MAETHQARRLASQLIRLSRELLTIRRQSALARPLIPENGIVLEIGGGQHPHPRSSVVVDLYLDDNYERPGEKGISFAKPLIVADAHQLPFEPKCFDFVIALHVMEHSNNPRQFGSEMMRVARQGFVQVPSRLAEQVFGWDYHPWLIDVPEPERIVFSPKQYSSPSGDVFHELYDSSPLTKVWFASHRDLWHHSMQWREKFDVEVIGQASQTKNAAFDLDRTTAFLGRSAVSAPPLPKRIVETLICPRCSNHLEGFRCSLCGAEYPVVNGIPILVSVAAR